MSDVLVQGLAGIARAVVAVALAWRLQLELSKDLADPDPVTRQAVAHALELYAG